MLTVVLVFLFLSIFLYALLGGADFGIGVLELLSSSKNREKTKKTAYRVIGPVWEANHVWLIIVLVILWIGFPTYFQIIMIYLHFPLSIALLGIIVRGVSFIFRHYDAVKDGSQVVYDKMFEWSSLITPLFLGVSFGALLSGSIDTRPIEFIGFYEAFITPWLNIFTLSIGLFFVSLCTFNSSIFIIGETTGEEKAHFIRKAKHSTLALSIAGSLVVLISILQNNALGNLIKEQIPIAILVLIFGLILLFLLWRNLNKHKKVEVRIIGILMSLTILGGLLFLYFPNIIISIQGKMNILEDTAPDTVINSLGVSLLIGGVFIIPGLFHLLKSFGMLKIMETDQ
jgi:cytochrome d ubiquinol oxidase subunit II